jgi:hypothetical protein
MEHRWGCRVLTDLPVRLVVLPEMMVAGRMLDVSLTGAFVQTAVPCPLLSLVYLEQAAFPSAKCELTRIPACLVRRTESGIGLEWCDLANEAVDLLLGAARAIYTSHARLRQGPMRGTCLLNITRDLPAAFSSVVKWNGRIESERCSNKFD